MVVPACKQMLHLRQPRSRRRRGRHGGGSAILWYMWPSQQRRCCASCSASSTNCYSSPSNPPDVCKPHLELENWKGYRKGLQGGLVTLEKEHHHHQQQQQQQQQKALMSNKHRAMGQLAVGLFCQDDGSLPPIVKHINFWRIRTIQDFRAHWSCCAFAVHALYIYTHVPVSAAGQLCASYTPSTTLAWLWSAPGSSSMCCSSKQFTEDDLKASLQLHEEENK
eukprot:1158106-Pelagomonas_calceolata.AAC.5